MANTAHRKSGRPALPPEERLVNEAPIAMRLTPAEKERTQVHARREGRSLASFARRIYLIGLDQYEADLARNSTH